LKYIRRKRNEREIAVTVYGQNKYKKVENKDKSGA
jgi:hypothetical protein